MAGIVECGLVDVSLEAWGRVAIGHGEVEGVKGNCAVMGID
jgi:hypothetical protein